jgi:hypothetical protein
MEYKTNACRIVVAEPEEKRLLGRSSVGDIIKMDLREIEWGGVDWIDLV